MQTGVPEVSLGGCVPRRSPSALTAAHARRCSSLVATHRPVEFVCRSHDRNMENVNYDRREPVRRLQTEALTRIIHLTETRSSGRTK